MTKAEYVAQENIQLALSRVRLHIVGTPRAANILGFTGIAYGWMADGKLVVDDDGDPVVMLAALVNLN